MANEKQSSDKQQELGHYDRPALQAPVDPPPYSSVDENHNQAIPGYESHQEQAYGNDEKTSTQVPNGPPGYPPSNQYGNQPQAPYGNAPYQNYPPPGVYTVPKIEDTVNIANARPDQVNPAYQDYLRADQQRLAQGNFPNNYQKPLAERKVNKNNRTGGGAFPGRSGASYYDAANK